jgi:hypothetical protein
MPILSSVLRRFEAAGSGRESLLARCYRHDRVIDPSVGAAGWVTRQSRFSATRYVVTKFILRMFALLVTVSPAGALAGGTCLLHPEPFKLQSDTVHWSVKMVSGGQCIQGLRWSTIMIDHIAIAEMPKAGRLIIQGPSFRYLSDPGMRGSDSFKLTITGSSMHIAGSSSIEVEVTSQ